MIILAIETSCDETAIAVVETDGDLKRRLARPNPPAGGERGEFKILSNIVSSQVKVHAPFWGVVPNLAKREHQRNLVPLLLTALQESRIWNLESGRKIRRARPEILDSEFQILDSILVREQELLEQFKKSVIPLKPPRIDLIAVTHGPGLEPALWVGVNFAKVLGFLWKKPIIGINHLEGHIVANWLKPIGKTQNAKLKTQTSEIRFPALCLVVSGGHTQLVLMKDFGKYRTIGETRDDAAGEAFDKVARMLNLGYPGGPAIAAEAVKCQVSGIRCKVFDVKLPRPMINSKDYDFSFSGLKTAVLYLIKDLERKGYSLKEFRVAVAAEFQQAVIDVLISKTLKAAENYKVKSVLLGGGVSANKNLRQQMKKAVKEKLPKVIYHEPDLKFTTDNAAMIAAAARFHLKEKKNWSEMEAEANLRLG